MEINRIALIGMGAIGTVYGRLLHERYGENFAVVASGRRAERLQKQGAVLNGKAFYPRIVSPGAEGFSANLILLCVKNYQLDEALEDIKPFVSRKTVLLPLLNGVTAKDRILKAFPNNPVFYGLSIYIDAVRDKDGVVNVNDGVIQFGYDRNDILSPEAIAVKDCLTSAGITAEICPDMVQTVWRKWMLNVGCNQVSAVTGACYGEMASIEAIQVLFHEAMMEVVSLAKASGIDLGESDVLEMEKVTGKLSPSGKTSMLQDIEAGRQTEVDYFAGSVIELGKKLHVPTPVNHVLYYIIKSLEQRYLSF